MIPLKPSLKKFFQSLYVKNGGGNDYNDNFPLDVFKWSKHDNWHLPDGVTVAQKILALFVEVRILVGQPFLIEMG